MKGKIKRLTSGEPKAKVDASSWTPPEMMNTEAKTGMRPISRRAFRKGGKVIEKCEGGEAMKRADRKQRKSGGRSLVTDLINRNDKKANLARDGGGAHVGGYKRGGDVEQDKKLIKKALAQHDKHMHGGKHEEIKLKKGGKAKKLHKQKGGSTTQPPKGEESDFDRRTRELMPPPKQGEMPADADMRNPVTGAPRTGRKKGGGTYFGGTRPTGGRMPKAYGGSNKGDSKTPARELFDRMYAKSAAKEQAENEAKLRTPEGEAARQARNAAMLANMRKGRKSGGRAKDKKTNIVISINAQPKDQQQPMMPKMPTPSPLPVPPIAPPAMGAGAPPMPMPPIAPPPGLAGGAPGMPPLPRKRGGRAYRSYKDMDAGALSGMGRLEKTEIEHGKRVGRLSGGRARSYKDMDAGALSGMGRIEKTAIQKHKR
jgi:hypothetical protein